MYYIYHIPARRQWGCTENLLKRLKSLKRRKGYTINDVTQIYTCTDLDQAADMERDLNIKYGYGWNKSRDYRIVITKASKGGEAAAKVNLASGQIQELGKTGIGGKARGEQIKEQKRLKAL
jgi:hypothetical protein